MDLTQPLMSFLGILVSVLLTVIVYQWKVMRDEGKTLQQLSLLIHEPGVLQKIYIYMKMDDPVAAAKERYRLENRVEQLEEIIQLMVTKRDKALTMQKIIEEKARRLTLQER